MKELSLQELIINLHAYLLRIGYSHKTIERLEAYYVVFLRYSVKKGVVCFTLDFGKQYLQEHFNHQWDDHGKQEARELYLQRHMLMLDEFQRYGEIRTFHKTKRIYHIPHFQQIKMDYIVFLREKGLKQVTIRSKMYVVNVLLEYLESQEITDLEQLKAEHFYGFMEQKMEHSVSSKQHYLYVIRAFIKFMAEQGLCNEKLACLFPVITVNGKNAYPSYFKKTDVIKILQSVDTSTAIGKREYLILLIAAQLGLRTNDISSLKLQDIDFSSKHLSFIASKTGKLQRFELSSELLYAFADYIKNARRSCSFDSLFITDYGELGPFKTNSFHRCITKNIKKAGVKLPAGQKRGLHALRASLAMNMLESGTSLPTISNILGHSSLSTSKHYIKIDVEGLRHMALEAPT